MQSCSNFEKAVRTDEFKLIQTGRESAPLLYRWRRDRQERRDLAGQRGARSTVRRMDRWLREFIPPDVIRVRFLPDVAPYEMRLTLESPQRILKGGRRLPDGPIEGDESAFRWEGRIDREAVDLQVPLGERGGLIYVRAERADGLPLVERTWIGQTPLAASTAVPVFVAAGAPARGSRYDLSFEPASHTWGFALDLPSAAAAEIEVRDQRASPKESFAIIESEGFELDRVGAPGVFAFLRGKGPGKAHARVRYPAGDGNALALLRVDGRWPEFEEVSFDGEAVRSDRIEFALAHQSDQRLTAALLAGPAPDAGPGGILIWLQGGASGTAIDPAGLSKDRVEQLRALGYIH
jgi:hypothetical protein